MTRSVPRNIDRKGEHLSQCDVCGVMYLRSALSRGRDSLLRCVNDRPGRDELTLAELTAARAAALSARLASTARTRSVWAPAIRRESTAARRVHIHFFIASWR